MTGRMLLAALLAVATVRAGGAQETKSESALQTAIKQTITRGFSYTIRPDARIPNFSKARLALAGLPVEGQYSDGVFHATDGKYEIYRKGRTIAVKTGRGWLPLLQFVSPLRQDVEQAFDGRLWRRGNVTLGRESLDELIRINHLIHRSDITRLTNVGSAFVELRRVGTKVVGKEKMELYEGDFNDHTAFIMLQGPFEEQVRRGNVSFQSVSGVGQVYMKDGVVRRVYAQSGGKYGFYNEEDNVRRRGFCTLEIAAEIFKVGETVVEPPKEVLQIFDRRGR